MKKCFFLGLLVMTLTVFSQTKTTYTYSIKGKDTLKLDIYTPENLKKTDKLPVILWMHGGGFSGGSRANADEVKFCNYLANQEYLAVSISYRLTRKGAETGFGCDCKKEEKLKTFKLAVEDYLDAALFLVDHKDVLNLNTSKIIAGGSSAGAEGVLNAVYMRPYYITDLSRYDNVSFAGIWSLAGAVLDADYITPANAVPTVLFHGTKDNLVPYATAPHHYCEVAQPGYLLLDGASTIVEKLDELGQSYYFTSVKGGKHEIAQIPFQDLDNVLQFFNDTVMEKQNIQLKKHITP